MDDVLALHQQKNDLLHQHGYLVRSIWKYEWSRRRTADPAIRTFLKMHQTPRPLDPRDVFFGRRNKRLSTQPERGRRRTYPLLRFQEPVPLREQILPLSRGLSPDHLPTASRPRPRRVFRLCLLYRFTDLLHPVLPYRCSQKHTFPLCAACIRQYIVAPLLD